MVRHFKTAKLLTFALPNTRQRHRMIRLQRQHFFPQLIFSRKIVREVMPLGEIGPGRRRRRGPGPAHA